jgi:hypothetical protein
MTVTPSTRYDIRCDREAWHNTTLHCSLTEAIKYAYNLCDEETGSVDVMTTNAKGYYVVAYTVSI